MRTVVDDRWSDWLPIYAWLIEHPEGAIMVDTGETARTAQPGYFPRWHPYYRHGVQFDVSPEDEIGPQLENHWLSPTDVRKVVMTHLHTDHAGGLHHVPHGEVLIERQAFAAARGLLGRVRGFVPQHWPDWLHPTLFDLPAIPFGPFARSLPVTETGDVVIVPTPGHTPQHISVVVRTDEVTYFLGGDASYTEELMWDGHVDGIAPNEELARDTLHRIRCLAEQEPVVYLPSHDPGAVDRLASQQHVGGQTALTP
jgi:glyoxylase-like metal-dependent hydrolase (beta-lactamase superfamily II)